MKYFSCALMVLMECTIICFFFFSSRRRHTRYWRDWSSDVCSSDLQTARAAVDSGAIGVPHAATAFMVTPGHERWHHDPEFYYRPGGGPLLDMGPYYLTSLVHLLGPVRRVVGASSRAHTTRTIGEGPRAGTTFDVEIDTHITGILEHESGALTTLLMSFDTWAATLPRIEVYGADGSLSVPDPNYFDGDVRRSEEHTSELQSRQYLVCRLLLEKKK